MKQSDIAGLVAGLREDAARIKQARRTTGQVEPYLAALAYRVEAHLDQILAALSAVPGAMLTRDQAAKIAEGHAAPEGVPQIDYDRACHDIAAAFRELSSAPTADVTQPNTSPERVNETGKIEHEAPTAEGEMVLVPRVPTEEMIEAGADAWTPGVAGHGLRTSWAAMLDAATPKASGGER